MSKVNLDKLNKLKVYLLLLGIFANDQGFIYGYQREEHLILQNLWDLWDTDIYTEIAIYHSI